MYFLIFTEKSTILLFASLIHHICGILKAFRSNKLNSCNVVFLGDTGVLKGVCVALFKDLKAI